MIEKVSRRRCLACRNSATKDQLFRVVVGGATGLKFDSSGKLLGRGAYIHRLFKCVIKAPPAKVWAHTLKVDVNKIGSSAVSDLVNELKCLVEF